MSYSFKKTETFGQAPSTTKRPIEPRKRKLLEIGIDAASIVKFIKDGYSTPCELVDGVLTTLFVVPLHLQGMPFDDQTTNQIEARRQFVESMIKDIIKYQAAPTQAQLDCPL